jgi:hypothetical protein
MRNRCQFSIVILHFALCILHFAIASLAAATASAAPLAVPTSGEPFPAELILIDANWQITFRTGQTQRTIPAADLVSWGQCPEQGGAATIVLSDGSLLAAEVTTADKQRLSATSELFGKVTLPLDSLAGIIFRRSSNPADGDKLLDRILSPRPLGEGPANKNSPLPLGEGPGVRAVLLLDNGDELTGSLLGIADGTVKLETDVGPVSVKTDRATALIFHAAQKRKPTAVGRLQAWAGFSDGSRLLVSRLLIEANSLKLTAASQPLSVPPAALIFLQPLGGRVVYLSDLKPTEYHQTPYLDLPWPYHADRNVTGGQLRCGGRLYLKGLGVHSAARLVYSPLPLGEGPGVRAVGVVPSSRHFQAALGIDDSTAGGGSVQFRVLVDGQEKYASPIIRGGNPPLPVSVDVTGAKKLELIVDYADRADVLDYADWLNARLILQ